MESRAPSPGFSLDALIAEAKRRARQRRLLVALLLLAVAAAVAAVVLGSPGGGSRSGGSARGLGSGSAGSQSVQIGAFALTIPRGFYTDKVPCPVRHCQPPHSPTRVLVSNRPFTPTSSQIYPANRVVLDIGWLSPAPSGVIATQRLPLDLHKLKLMGHRPFGNGTSWAGFVSGGGSVYQLWVFEGRNTSPADRASVLRALGSIHRAG